MKEGLEKKRQEVKVAFHVPGHHFGRLMEGQWKGNLLDYDFTEIDGTDNLHHAEGIIMRSQERVASIYGSKYCRFLVNGTSGGILSALYALVGPGDKVLIPREVHKSVINGLELSGAIPVFIRQEMLSTGLIYSQITPEDVEEAVVAHPEAKILLLTYPNYYGHCFDIKKVVEIAHKYDRIVVVDSAHGSHFALSHSFPQCAVEVGADIVVQSTHKTLLGMTQSSWLHVNGNRVDMTSLDRALAIFQSSSPSYILMTSLDLSAEVMISDGADKAASLLDLVADFRSWASSNGIGFLEDAMTDKIINDPSRINLDAYSLGMTGYDLGNALQAYGIYTEMQTRRMVVLVSTIASTSDDFGLLKETLLMIKEAETSAKEPIGSIVEHKAISIQQENDLYMAILYNEMMVGMDEGALGLQEVRRTAYELCPLHKAEGRIAYSQIVPYPPGVPLCLPGMRLNKGIIAMALQYIEAGHELHGITKKDGGYLIDVIRIV